MQKVSVFFIIIVVVFISVAFKPFKKDKVQWLTVAELQVMYSKNPKPVLVDLYTSWCGWCKVMDKETYSNENVANYINENYYAVKLDAEQKETLEWNGKKYNYDKRNKVNQLAVYLTGGQLSFPTTIFITDLNKAPAPLAGYLKVREIEAPLKYYGGGAYKTQNFEMFYKTFSSKW